MLHLSAKIASSVQKIITGKMINRKIIYFLVIFHVLPLGNKATSHPFLSKLVSQTRSINNQIVNEKKHKPIEADLKCKYRCIAANELAPRFQARNQVRFIDQGNNDTIKSSEIETPTNKFSFFNLLSGDEDGEDGEDDDHDDEEKLKRVEEDEEDDDDGDDDEDEENYDNEDDISFGFFTPEEEMISDKLEGTKGENLLKQYHRQRIRMHNLLFPLLLAYKLKFFTVIPLLLGSLVLLIGSTGIAGFFFALFAAALGIHAKAQQH